MKQLIYILTLALMSSLVTTGCKKEAKLTPTTTPEDIYGDPTLPQGNHPYDAEILQLFKNYHTLFLYKYQPKDLFYNVTDDIGGTYDTATDKITKPGWFAVPADQQYVGMQLDMLKEIWLNFYPDSLLRKGLPQKVYLLDSFYFASLPYPYTAHGRPIDFINLDYFGDGYVGGDHIIATWGGARITNIAKEDKYTLKARLNTSFLNFARAKGAIRLSTAFTAITDYSAVDYYNYYEMGVLDWTFDTPEKDWDGYVQAIVSNSYDTLTAAGNILDPSVDVNGAIRKKYDIILAYFQSTYGVDLQAIGNAGI